MPSTATSMLDGLSTSVAVKAPCKAVATSNITLSGEQTINSVAVVDGDRVLVTAQTTSANNGIYVVSTGAWSRALDADGNRDLVQGTRVPISASGSNAIEYELRTANPITIGTSSLTFTQRYGANATYDRTTREISAGVVPTNYSYLPGDVRRYGAIGDGITNDTDAIQDAIDAAGVAGEVIFPAIGIFKCTGSLTSLNFQTWRGASYEFGAGGSQAALQCTLTNGTFINAATSMKFENLRFYGAAVYNDTTGATTVSTAVAIELTDNATFHDCVFQAQYQCLETHSCHYLRVYGGEVVRCGTFVAMLDADVFNLEIDGTIFRLCSAITVSTDTPKRYVHNLKVMGGSFESWVGLFNCIRTASFFGTYFESDIVGGFGFNSDGGFTTETCINLYGCLIFLNNLNRFVNYSGLTKCSFVSIGNTIAGSVNSGENQYYFVPPDSGSRIVLLDSLLDDRGTGTFRGTYVSDLSKVRNQLIVWPIGSSANHANHGQTWIDGAIVSYPLTFTNGDTTPSVAGGGIFRTGGAATITAFDDGVTGQSIKVFVDHATTFDCTGTTLKGNGGADISAAVGDWIEAVFDGTNWRISFHDCTA